MGPRGEVGKGLSQVKAQRERERIAREQAEHQAWLDRVAADEAQRQANDAAAHKQTLSIMARMAGKSIQPA